MPEFNPDAVLQFEGVSVRRGGATLLDSIDWTVEEDERWAVLGPNGAGKTTLLQIAAAAMHPSGGTARVFGEQLGRVDVFELRPRIGLASAALADRIPGGEKVGDVVVSAGYSVIGRWREEYAARRRAARRRRCCTAWGSAASPSGVRDPQPGREARVQIARALMTDPELLLLDEPAAGMDLVGARTCSPAQSLFEDADAPATVLVTHHVEELPPGITHVMLLRDGGVVASGLACDVLTAEKLSATFGLPIQVERRRGRWYARAR